MRENLSQFLLLADASRLFLFPSLNENCFVFSLKSKQKNPHNLALKFV